MTLNSRSDQNSPVLNLVPQKKRLITENEWVAVWNDFMAVYVIKYQEQLSDLLTYGKHIKEMMRIGLNWRYYDRHFRTARETTRCSWSTVRVDFQLNAVLPAASDPK